MNVRRVIGSVIGCSVVVVGLSIVATESSVGAWCAGYGQARYAYWNMDGSNRGEERTPSSYDCNALYLSNCLNSGNPGYAYAGQYRDMLIDQRDVYVQATIDGSNFNFPVYGGTVKWKPYNFCDLNDYAPIKVCMTNVPSCDTAVSNSGF